MPSEAKKKQQQKKKDAAKARQQSTTKTTTVTPKTVKPNEKPKPNASGENCTENGKTGENGEIAEGKCGLY